MQRERSPVVREVRSPNLSITVLRDVCVRCGRSRRLGWPLGARRLVSVNESATRLCRCARAKPRSGPTNGRNRAFLGACPETMLDKVPREKVEDGSAFLHPRPIRDVRDLMPRRARSQELDGGANL